MAFITEQTGYIKTAMSDLQGAWGNLRDAVVENFSFPDSDKLLFHIDEAMSWESVRNLDAMKNASIVIQNIALQSGAPDDVIEWIEDVRDALDEVLKAIANGEVL
jgi:hypothetical protein